MFREEKMKSGHHKITIRIHKDRAREFSQFRRDLQALLKKHNLKREPKPKK